MVVGFYVGSFFCFTSVSCTLTGPWVKKQFFLFSTIPLRSSFTRSAKQVPRLTGNLSTPALALRGNCPGCRRTLAQWSRRWWTTRWRRMSSRSSRQYLKSEMWTLLHPSNQTICLPFKLTNPAQWRQRLFAFFAHSKSTHSLPLHIYVCSPPQ